MKIYTKTGDEGTTGLVGGKRISKSHLRLEAYGTFDELNSVIGCVRSGTPLGNYDSLLEAFQNDLFNAGSRLACTDEKILAKLPELRPAAITDMESAIDAMTTKLPPLKNFILPGGTSGAALLHLARTVCRRAERLVVRLKDSGEAVDDISIQYLNRMSDCLFVLARYVNFEGGVEDVLWKPNKS